jgi:hypothetical protein
VQDGQDRDVSSTLPCAAAVADRRVTGLSREVLAELVAELGPRWQARRDARLADRPRRRAVGAGARHRLVFIDRLLATLAHLRHGVTHDVLACWCAVSRSTITRAVGEVRPLLAERGCTVEGGLRLRTLADVITHLGASGAGRPARCHRGPGAPPGGPPGRPAAVHLREGPRHHRPGRWSSPTLMGGCCSADRPARAPSTT